MSISEALADIFDRLYESRLELVEVLEKKGIQYPSDLTRIDEWGTVRIVSQYLGMELDEYTVEEVEHLKRRKGKLLTGGNVTSFRDSLQVARQMVPSITNHFDQNDVKLKSLVFDIPTNTKLYWAVTNLSNTINTSIGVGIIDNKYIIYSMTGGLSWDYFDLGIADVDIISIQPVYSYYLQMMLFLVRTEDHIYLYGASIGEKGFRTPHNLDRYGFLDKYKVVSLPDSSTIKMINIRRDGEEDFLIFMNSSVNDGDARLRIVHIATGSLQNTIADDRDDPVLANGFSFTEEEWPITPYGNRFYIVTRFCDTHYDNIEQLNQMKYGYMMLHRDRTLWMYKVTINDDRLVQFDYVMEIDANFLNSTVNLRDDFIRGRSIADWPGYEEKDDDLLCIPLSNGTKVYLYHNNAKVTSQKTCSDNSIIVYNGLVYSKDGKLYTYTNTESLMMNGVSDSKIFPCYSDDNTCSIIAKLSGEDFYRMIKDDSTTSRWVSERIFENSYKNNPFNIVWPKYTKLVNGVNGIQALLHIYDNLNLPIDYTTLFLSYDDGKNWNTQILSIYDIVGVWYFCNTWYACDKSGNIYYCKNNEAGHWTNGCMVDIPIIGAIDYFDDEKVRSIDLYRDETTLYLRTYSHDNDLAKLEYEAEIDLDILKNAVETVVLSSVIDSGTILNESYLPDMITNTSFYAYKEDVSRSGNSSSVIDPIDGIEKKYTDRILTPESRIEINQINSPIENISGSKLLDFNGKPFAIIEDTIYSLENGEHLQYDLYFNCGGPHNSLGYLTYDFDNKRLVMSTCSGKVHHYSIELPENIRIREVNGFFALIDDTNRIKFVDWAPYYDEPVIITPDPVGDNLQIVDCVYYNEKIWYLIVITVKGQKRVFIHPITIKDTFMSIWDEMKYTRSVFPNSAEMVCVSALDESITPSIQRGYNYLVIITNALYTYDGWHFNKCVLPENISVEDIVEVQYQDPTVYFYTSENLVGYMNDNKNFNIYKHIDGVSGATGWNVYTLTSDGESSVVVYRNGLNDPLSLHGVYGTNGDALISHLCFTDTPKMNMMLPNIRGVMNLILHINEDEAAIYLDTPAFTVEVESGVTAENTLGNIDEDSYSVSRESDNVRNESWYLVGTTL